VTLYDSTELARTGTRKFHTAWAELNATKILIPPTVGFELAPDGQSRDDSQGVSYAERRLATTQEASLPKNTQKYLERQAWWAMMWRSPESPYQLIRLTDDQRSLAEDLVRAIPPTCFPGAPAAHIREHRDTRIICETLAIGGKMLLTSNMRTIDHKRVNDWTVQKGTEFGFPSRPVVFNADAALALRLLTEEGLEHGMRTAILATWTPEPRTTDKIIDDSIDGLTRMTQGTGGHLRVTTGLIVEALEEYPDYDRLVTTVRERLPSPAVESDRAHPAHPDRPSDRTYGRTDAETLWTPTYGR